MTCLTKRDKVSALAYDYLVLTAWRRLTAKAQDRRNTSHVFEIIFSLKSGNKKKIEVAIWPCLKAEKHGRHLTF